MPYRKQKTVKQVVKKRVKKVEAPSFIPLIYTSKGAKSRKTARAISKIIAKKAQRQGRTLQATSRKGCLLISAVYFSKENLQASEDIGNSESRTIIVLDKFFFACHITIALL